MKEEWAKDLVAWPWCISEVLKAYEDCPELQAILDEYHKPVVIQDEVLGEQTSWELLSHWYSRDAKRVYYLNREIKGADRDSFMVCTPLDTPPLADHLAP